MSPIKRNLKLIMWMYALLVMIGASVALVACKDKLDDDNLYKFSESKFDESPDFDISFIKELYNNGVTLKRFNDVDYFIVNPNYTDSIEGIEAIKFGPLTTSNLDYELKFTSVDPSTQEYRINIKIPLISKYKGIINKTRFNISWVTYDSDNSQCKIVNLTPILNEYVNGLEYDATTDLNIFWNTDLSKVKNFSIYLCVEAINYTSDGNFREVMTFDLNRFK